ncbi:MAG: hypothetical protein E7461_04315 [Ruminococcaceae bacterium]|nr:hypothetical protein [Oscillospiraceae bacterium]
MNVTKKLTLDLMRRSVPQKLTLIRGDSAVALCCTLLCDGSPWEIPQNAAVILRYRNAEAGGEYDTLPDGKAAYSYSGNILTVYLAPAVCSMVGKTDFQAVIYVGASQKSTLCIPLFVEGAVSGSKEPESYTNLTQWLLQYGGGSDASGLLQGLYGEIDGLENRLSALENMPVYDGEMEDV